MNLREQQADLLAHYVRLAQIPGWKHYVWNRVKEMARACPELYGSFPQLLTDCMSEKARRLADLLADTSSPKDGAATTASPL